MTAQALNVPVSCARKTKVAGHGGIVGSKCNLEFSSRPNPIK